MGFEPRSRARQVELVGVALVTLGRERHLNDAADVPVGDEAGPEEPQPAATTNRPSWPATSFPVLMTTACPSAMTAPTRYVVSAPTTTIVSGTASECSDPFRSGECTDIEGRRASSRLTI